MLISTPTANVNIKKVNFSGSKDISGLKVLPGSKDVISFASSKPIFKRNGINPNDVIVKSHIPIDEKTKLLLLEKVLEAHEHAVKNKTLGNFSGRCYATNMKLTNGEWAKATNIEITAETVLCGERSALVRSWNNHLESLPVITDANKEEIKAKGDPKVEYLAMSSYQPPMADPGCGNPCSECLNWINTKRYFSLDTKIATINVDSESGKPVLNVRPVTAVLPYWGQEAPSRTSAPIDSLKLDITGAAAEAMKKNGITKEKLYETVKAAKEAYEEGKTAELSDSHNVGAAALLDPGDIITKGERMEWTRRWFEAPELLAATKGFQLLTKALILAREGINKAKEILPMLPVGTDKEHFMTELVQQAGGEAKINAIAYYGDDNVPYLDNLGKLSQGRGSGDSLILTIKDDKIEARTILDYMPHLYISSKKK
ncbi:MAG: hypothetical protein AB1782_03200 [Cyanobacteriota bacterium]